jgi:hypothetical protein
MVGCFLGVMLGFANVMFVAFAMGIADASLEGGWVATIGVMPGVLTGAILGVVASVTARAPRGIRLCVLALPALGVVWMLGIAFELERYVLLACIPTLVACILLERATRHGPTLPDARMIT